jgi:pimeloyl-ACP methyl ester carboxylesterase
VAEEKGHPADAAMISVDGAELYCTESGHGPPLLLVHGAGHDSRAWSPSLEDLARDHRVITYDRRGYGRSSDAPLVGGWRQHGEDAAQIITKLGAGPMVVAGWSGGGNVALHLGAEHADLVRSLVLAETPLTRPFAVPPSVVWDFLLIRVQRLFRGDRAAAEEFARWVTSENGSNSYDRPDYPQERRDMLLDNVPGLWADFSLRGRPDLSDERLQRVRCPVTYVVGDMGQPLFRRSAEAFAERLPDATITTIPGSNHAFTFHQPERFAEAIREAAQRDTG